MAGDCHFWCSLAFIVFQVFVLLVVIDNTLNGHIVIDLPDGVAADSDRLPSEPTTAILWQLGDPPL
jgi:hypothetical protein